MHFGTGSASRKHAPARRGPTPFRNDPAAIANPGTVAASMVELRCRNIVPGASGFIAIGPDGNPINKGMPILEISPSASVAGKEFPQGPAGELHYYTTTSPAPAPG